MIVNPARNAFPHHCPVCHVTSMGSDGCINDHCGGDALRYHSRRADFERRLEQERSSAALDIPEEKK